jgi:hypothetical protein
MGVMYSRKECSEEQKARQDRMDGGGGNGFRMPERSLEGWPGSNATRLALSSTTSPSATIGRHLSQFSLVQYILLSHHAHLMAGPHRHQTGSGVGLVIERKVTLGWLPNSGLTWVAGRIGEVGLVRSVCCGQALPATPRL